MSESFGRVKRRADGRIYLCFARYGKVYSARGTPFRTVERATFVLGAIRAAVSEGTPKQVAVDRWLPVAGPAHRCGRWLGAWLASMRRLEATGERSRAYLDELERWCADGGHIAGYWSRQSVHAIDYASLEEWSGWLVARGLGPKTRHNVMGALHSFLGWLRRTGEIQVVPPFPWPRLAEHAPILLTAAAQGAVLAAIPEERRGIFLALALLGLRPSEARRARAADYQPGDPGWLTVPRTKNRQAKRLPVPPELAAWIAARVPREARLTGAPLFAVPYCGRGRRPRGPWSESSLRREWRTACQAAGATASLYEGTKHSRATDLLLQGVPERVLQALLGHRDARSTRRYARLADSALVDVLAPRCSDAAPALKRRRKAAKEQG